MKRIGTPLFPSATRVMLLGSGELGAVIYGSVDAVGIAFENVAAALQVPQSDLRLFGKPEPYVKRLMSVTLANGTNIVEARERAKPAAARVKPVAIY